LHAGAKKSSIFTTSQLSTCAMSFVTCVDSQLELTISSKFYAIKYKERIWIAIHYHPTHNTANLGADDNGYEGCGSSDEDEQEAVDLGGLSVLETGSPSGEDNELKNRLLNKYSGYLSNLWRELSRKKKKGKLPRDARQKLLHWWQLHYRWPYPSVRESFHARPSCMFVL
jgi:hypothetical protein